MRSSYKNIFFLLFFLSGFSGLIYESIWSHYLKLFLGHAAYAQTLVLAIFMGGMAIGSLASGFLIHRWRRLLIGYAVVEAIIGILAIVFHPVFTSVTELTFAHLINGQGDSPLLVMTIKWGVASLLIFPQSVLLGMTFPLMVGGIMRLYPEKPGYTLSMLYFTNSLGAVFGVLASSFIFIEWVGLPGTMLTAGLINLALALVVYSLAKNHNDAQAATDDQTSSAEPVNERTLVSPAMLLTIALLTGLSSFMYEIGWIRMLVLVMGGSTHSFELMLASFILGIALGGLWIRNRIDVVNDSRLFLGYVQLAMAIAAVLSLWLYHYSFDWMSMLLDTIQKKDSTYPVYLLFSGMISMIIMLPATFCAGMTLPLITRLIIKTRKKENGIGYVYSANTLGAIIGIFLSVHIILPTLGLKNLIIAGAAIDLILGAYLLRLYPAKLLNLPRTRLAVGTFTALFFCVTFLAVEFNANRLSSGVFRDGNLADRTEVIYHADGKTSTVTVSQQINGHKRLIKNNGKPDASLQMAINKPRAADEDTQVLLGALPLFQKPDAQAAAIIGMGSGMSTHTILGSPNLNTVDTIEMEAKVVEGARLFLPFVDRAYNDTRSNIYIEDAKTFFSTHDKQYDIIVSEPPNPWVSGVATLFSQEFYHRIKNHLTDDGIFVQWIQLYEIDIKLVATVFNAIDLEFDDYVVYRAGADNIVIMASANEQLKNISSDAFSFEGLDTVLKRSRINTIQDIEMNRVGSKRLLAPLFRRLSPVVNSDYFPVLDNGAPRARYANANAGALTGLIDSSIPTIRFLEQRANYSSRDLTPNRFIPSLNERVELLKLRDLLLRSDNSYVKASTGATSTTQPLTNSSNLAFLLKHNLSNCGNGTESLALEGMTELGFRVVALLSEEEQAPFWDYIAGTQCISGASANKELVKWHKLFTATYQRDYKNMSIASTDLLSAGKSVDHFGRTVYLMSTGILGDVFQGDQAAAERRWAAWGGKLADSELPLSLSVLLSAVGVVE